MSDSSKPEAGICFTETSNFWGQLLRKKLLRDLSKITADPVRKYKRGCLERVSLFLILDLYRNKEVSLVLYRIPFLHLFLNLHIPIDLYMSTAL